MSKHPDISMPSVQEVAAILAEPKLTVRIMEWVPKRTIREPQWTEFVSACRIQNEIREDVMFIAQYRPARAIVNERATIEIAEVFNAAILVGPHRVVALDTVDIPHKNLRGIGLPYHKKLLSGRTHRHIWTSEGYGYAEPVEPSLDDVESLLSAFVSLTNLTLTGGFKHPLSNQQMELL